MSQLGRQEVSWDLVGCTIRCAQLRAFGVAGLVQISRALPLDPPLVSPV